MKRRQPAGMMQTALEMLGRRDYTCHELEVRLRNKGHERPEVQEVLDRLKCWGYLNDRAVARRAFDDCLKRRPRGRELLCHELAARGIAERDIVEVIAAYSPQDEEEAAVSALARLGINLPLDAGNKPRAWRALTRLGFTDRTIERICGLPDP